jgi:phospholipid/cholesterol/gamma-HCH transport system substrate-binding protein
MKRKSDILVGLVVLIIAAATIGAVAWVKQADIGKRQRELVARFRDVGNARVGNTVVIRGVVGGRVQAIDPSVQLPADPVVLLNESSLFGEWQATVIERNALPHDEAVQHEIDDPGRGRGVLPGASQPGIGKLTAVAGQIAGDVANVAGRVEVAFDEQAARELRGSIRNVADLSTTLSSAVKAHASDLDVLSAELRKAIETLNRTANSVQTTAIRVDSATTSPQVRSIVTDVAAASVELRRAATQVNDLSRRFATSQSRLDVLLATGDSLLAKINSGQGSLGLFVNDPSMYRRTDSLLVQLRALAADIQANPKKYISVRIF